jgi:hypothetical protein
MQSDIPRPLSLPEDIDDLIENLVQERGEQLTVTAVVRDIARWACIVNLVNRGYLDGKMRLLGGGMAMRCYKSNRASVYDADTSSRLAADREELADVIAYEDDDIFIKVRAWQRGKNIEKAEPIEFRADFTALALDDTTFSLSESSRGIKRKANWLPIQHGYPFEILANPGQEIPVMDRMEILAEKLCGWMMFGLAKHYSDIAYIGSLLQAEILIYDPETRSDLSQLLKTKIDGNRKVGAKSREIVESLTPAEQRKRLLDPEEYVDPDPRKSFASLGYLHGEPLSPREMSEIVKGTVFEMLFGRP